MDAESSGLGMIAVSGGVRKPNKRSDFRGAFKPMGSTVPHTMKNRGFRSKIFSWGDDIISQLQINKGSKYSWTGFICLVLTQYYFMIYSIKTKNMFEYYDESFPFDFFQTIH